MRRALMYAVSALLLVCGAGAQNPEQSPSAGSESNTSVSGDKSGMQTSPGSAAQGQAGQVPNSSSSFAAGTVIGAELTKSIDAKKAKSGDQFTAKVLNDLRSESGVVVPRGSKLVGHVTEAKPRAKGESDSILGIAFDKIEVKNGQEIPVHAAIQAVARPQTAAMESASTSGGGGGNSNPSGYGGMSPGGRSSGSMPSPQAGGNAGGQGTGMPSGAPSGAEAGPEAPTGGNSGGGLTSTSRGVMGMEGVTLNASQGQGSVLTSSRGNVHLDSGTQMVLRVTTQ